MTENEIEVVDAMAKMGGSFVKALAECFRCADAVNFKRLRDAFPEYWRQYQEWVRITTQLRALS
jgi:hypothetical protein